jgi:16S rRNA C967 or C1407 C5-methylase (RsmB/RsmF family)
LERPLKKEIPSAFIENLYDHFGNRIAEKTLSALGERSSISIRLNPLKPIERFKNHAQVPWTTNGFILNERPVFSLDPLYHAGSYYVQDSSSMILETILNKVNLDRNGLYLDACAAPGGKSTILLDYLDNEGFLIANEVDPKRNSILRENILKWGRLNVGVTSLPTKKFDELHCAFDLILIDAPCSGEGMFRKDAFAIEQWSQNLVESCALTQTNILGELTPTLKEGGVLIYSTCTTNKSENEFQLQALLETGQFDIIEIDLSAHSKHLIEAKSEGKTIGYYLLPGTSTGEGLFISALRKTTHSIHENNRNNRIKTAFETSHQEFKLTFP